MPHHHNTTEYQASTAPAPTHHDQLKHLVGYYRPCRTLRRSILPAPGDITTGMRIIEVDIGSWSVGLSRIVKGCGDRIGC